MKLLSSVLPAQESYACDVEGVDADFLLLMAGVVKSGVCSKADAAVEHCFQYDVQHLHVANF